MNPLRTSRAWLAVTLLAWSLLSAESLAQQNPMTQSPLPNEDPRSIVEKPDQQNPLTSKPLRTTVRKKIDSALLQEIARLKSGERARTMVPKDMAIRLDRKQRALVDVRVDVTPAFERALKKTDATIESTSVEAHSVIAWIPLRDLEKLAADPAVKAIVPAAQATVHR